MAFDVTTHDWLVIGADGIIGSAVVQRLLRAGVYPWETTRRPGTLGPRRLEWELGRPLPLPDRLGKRPLVAIIAVGGTTVRECEENPEATFRRNVDETARLIDQLRGVEARTVYFSTNLVFDQSMLLPNEMASPHPRTHYGRQKLAVEQLLLQDRREPRGCVLRLTKTLPARWPLLDRWADELRRAGEIRPYARMACAPLSAEFVAEAAIRAALQPDLELLHVSPRDDVSYVEIAERWADRLGRSSCRIVSISPDHDGLCEDIAPARTALDTSLLEQTLGLTVPPSWETLDAIMETMHPMRGGRTK